MDGYICWQLIVMMLLEMMTGDDFIKTFVEKNKCWHDFLWSWVKAISILNRFKQLDYIKKHNYYVSVRYNYSIKVLKSL